MESAAVLNIGVVGSKPEVEGGLGFDLDFPTLNKSKKAGVAAFGVFFDGFELEVAKVEGKGFE